MLSMTTDYFMARWSPEPYLRRIAEAGFSHIHWCHQWNTDFLYDRAEIEQIGRWLADFGLGLLDLHASHGVEKKYMAVREYERLAGLELVKNRIAMTARLGGDVIILHIVYSPEEEAKLEVSWGQLCRSLDELEPVAREHGVRIAVENGTFPPIRRLFSAYGPSFLGLCYDSGHGNFVAGGGGLDELEGLKDRLISVHLHDNNGREDQHQIPFSGTVDWPRLASILAASAYTKCVSMESTMGQSGIADEREFLQKAFEAGTRLSRMVEECRASPSGFLTAP